MSKVRQIIEKAGGATRISEESRSAEKTISSDAVYKWLRIGIPDDHWPILIRLAGVTPADLYEANQSLKKSSRRGRPSERPSGRAVA